MKFINKFEIIQLFYETRIEYANGWLYLCNLINQVHATSADNRRTLIFNSFNRIVENSESEQTARKYSVTSSNRQQQTKSSLSSNRTSRKAARIYADLVSFYEKDIDQFLEIQSAIIISETLS